MIGGRAEFRYLDLVIDPNTCVATFDFAIGDDFRDSVEIHIRNLPAVAASKAASLRIEGGEKIIRVWDGPIGKPGSNVLEWFTTEKLIWDRSRGRAGIERLERYREAASYDLLYVGIAKVGDSFDRLISNGYVICQALAFNTAYGRIQGSHDAATGSIADDADSIFVEGNSLKLFVSGVDFPAELTTTPDPDPLQP